jgi:hypothetical protein
MTVDANLGSEREPGGEPDVNQAQIRIKEIKVQDALLPPRVDQAGTILTVLDFEAWAALHAAKNADESLADRTLSQDLVDNRFLAMRSLKELVFGASLLRQSLRVLDNDLGLFLSKDHEFAAPNPEDVVDEALKRRPACDRQITREANPVKTREHGNDQTGKLGDEARQRLHGVLLLRGWFLAKPIVEVERRFCSYFLSMLSETCGREEGDLSPVPDEI